jgi:uncharacterized membrane protein YeaQ/YmgE (transglycosylase-associated protein family)
VRTARVRAMLEVAMEILSWLLFGLVAGVIAKVIMPGKDPGGWIVTIGLGIAGSFVGGYAARLLGLGVHSKGFNLPSLATAVGGALLLLLAYRIIKRG